MENDEHSAQQPGIDPQQERVDADAVCVQCGTVNPEDTLLCRTCGNNLRDQRVRRVTEEGAGIEVGERPAWFARAVTVLGILVVLLVVANLGKIQRWLIDIQSVEPTAADARALWRGPASEIYDQLLDELARNPVTDADAAAALGHHTRDETFDGRYVLRWPDAVSVNDRIGCAMVRQKGGEVYFAADLDVGLQVRGLARIEANGRAVARDMAGVRIDSGYYPALGVAVRAEAGGYECYVRSEAGTETYRLLAYRVP